MRGLVATARIEVQEVRSGVSPNGSVMAAVAGWPFFVGSAPSDVFGDKQGGRWFGMLECTGEG